VCGNGYGRVVQFYANQVCFLSAGVEKLYVADLTYSGGLYYAAAVLAPPGYGPFAAWITGWSNWLSQVTGAPSVDYALSAMILAAASVSNPDYVPTEYQTFLLTVFVMLIHACISSMPTLWIARFNSYGSTLNMIGLVVVIIMIPASVTGTDTTPKFFPSSQVWSIQNGTDWPDGVAVLMSFIAIIWTMSGYGTSSPHHLH
jgi:amino acid transporter